MEGVKEEGNVDDERPSETLGVMTLEDIRDLNKRTAHVYTSVRIDGGGGFVIYSAPRSRTSSTSQNAVSGPNIRAVNGRGHTDISSYRFCSLRAPQLDSWSGGSSGSGVSAAVARKKKKVTFLSKKSFHLALWGSPKLGYRFSSNSTSYS